MPDPRLILPYDIEGALVDVLDRRHAEHLAKAERLRGDPPRTYERFATIVRMSDAGALRLAGDTVPACLIGVIGVSRWDRNEADGFDATYQVGMQVTVMGQRRRETLLRRDVLAWTTVECLLQRLPRDAASLIHSIRLVDYEPLAEPDSQRTLGDARIVFEVGVVNVMTLSGFLPADGSDWPPEAGGAPEEPYDPVAPRPTANPMFIVDQRPITE